MNSYDPSGSANPYDAGTPSVGPKVPDTKVILSPENAPWINAELFRAMHDYARKVNEARALDAELNKKYAEYLSIIAKEAELNRLKTKANAPVKAWCIDYTEGLSGEVATIEAPGEIKPIIGGGPINIRAGWTSNGASWSAGYGKLQHAATLSGAGFAWNFTMIQPWMKWMPKWRYATIQAIDNEANTAYVVLQPILSKAGSWLAKQRDFNDPWISSMDAVKIEYMIWNSYIFNVGDEVVVEFRNTSSGSLSFYEPYIIGFKQEPRIMDVIFMSNRYTEMFLGIYKEGLRFQWKKFEKWTGQYLTVFPAADGGAIIASGAIKIRRYDRNIRLLWSAGDRYVFLYGYDPVHNRILAGVWETGDILFYDARTGAASGSVNVTIPSTLSAVAADQETGELLYATFHGSTNEMHWEDSVVSIRGHSYPLSNYTGGRYGMAVGMVCGKSRIYMLMLVPDDPMPHHLLILSRSGSIMGKVVTPGTGADWPGSNGEQLSGLGQFVQRIPISQ